MADRKGRAGEIDAKCQRTKMEEEYSDHEMRDYLGLGYEMRVSRIVARGAACVVVNWRGLPGDAPKWIEIPLVVPIMIDCGGK